MRLEIRIQKLTLRFMWSAKAQLLRSADGAGATTGGHGGAVAAGKSGAFALHIRISNRTGREFLVLSPVLTGLLIAAAVRL